MGRTINNSLQSWCLVASGVVGIWVSSTSFQKIDMGWPQQPLTKKMVNFNMIFHESTKSIFFSKHQNKAEFKNLDDSKVLSRNFSDPRTSAASMTYTTASTTSMASMTFTASFHQKIKYYPSEPFSFIHFNMRHPVQHEQAFNNDLSNLVS